jgi:hypothetical protein
MAWKSFCDVCGKEISTSQTRPPEDKCVCAACQVSTSERLRLLEQRVDAIREALSK